MLVLYETPAGYSLFKLNDAKKYAKLEASDVEEALFGEEASSCLDLVSFQAFQDTADAVAAVTASQEGKLSERLQKFLKQKLKHESSSLAVADKALAVTLKDLVSIPIVHDEKSNELFRGIRGHLAELLEGTVTQDDLHRMQLGLSHALGRYKLKFSADKVDTMVIQGIGLLDELDKEINTYAMRVKEWYGWHFPELQALASDNVAYAKLVVKTGHRTAFANAELDEIVEDESSIAAIKEAAEISMGTDVTDVDVIHIQSLAEQVLSMTEYRAQLFEYLKNRMSAIAPNLTVLTGELVGARLIAHAGSLLNLAKQPASTIQILGAEKALFRALKTKHDTPKYGLIYHAGLVGQAAPKHKGKISRVLAAKAALAIRVDALTEDDLDTTVGDEGRAKVEARLRQLEGGSLTSSNNSALKAQKTARYDPVAAKTASSNVQYNTASDMQLDKDDDTRKPAAEEDKKKKKEKKAKKEKKRTAEEEDNGTEEGNGGESAKKRKVDDENEDDEAAAKKAAKKAKKAKKEKKEKKKSKD